MNDLAQTLKAGSLLIIETGEYSDKNWLGPVRVLRDFTKQEVADKYKKQHRVPDDEDWKTEPDPHDFLPWLVKRKYVEHVDADSWHVGSYGQFEP